MALIICLDCNNKFSTDAKRCPKCGAKPPIKKSTRVITCLILIMFFLGAVSERDHPKTNTPKPQLDYNQPIYTVRHALICPGALLLGDYLIAQQAISLYTSPWGNEERAARLGCAEIDTPKLVFARPLSKPFVGFVAIGFGGNGYEYFTHRVDLTNSSAGDLIL